MTNPLLTDWTTAFGLPPFTDISDNDFAPAVDAALETARANITEIAESAETATFDNTVVALELADAQLGRVLGAFYTLAGTDSNRAREELQRDFAPQLSAYGSWITGNTVLFERVEDLWTRRDGLELTDEQARVLMLTRRGFVRAGALLSGAQADRLREVKLRLSVLGTAFVQNLLADEREWVMALDKDGLAGLPDFVVATANSAGEEKDAGGPVVTLSRSLIVPFLQFSDRRDLRHQAYEAWVARGANGGKTDNREIAAETLALRYERAQLLGMKPLRITSLRPKWLVIRRL